MSFVHVYRADTENVGDWYSPPFRHFGMEGGQIDILALDPGRLMGNVIVGGGGLIAATFAPAMSMIADARGKMKSLVAWGIGESLHVDRKGGFVNPYNGQLPSYLEAFDLIGLRDFGTPFDWAPCASCMLPHFDSPPAPQHEIVIYEHKRISIPIDGFPRRTNDGPDLKEALAFIASGGTVITNSYHGAYWATLFGRKVFAIPNMSKVYRLKHAPVIGRAALWRDLLPLCRSYPEALEECRAASRAFHDKAAALAKW